MYSNKSSGLTRVYSYGAKPPVKNLADAQIELCLCKKLWNTLVDIEREYREARKKLLATPYDERLEELRTQLAELFELSRAHRSDAAYRTIQLGQAKAQAETVQTAVRQLLLDRLVIRWILTDLPGRKKYRSIPILLFADFQSYKEVEQAVVGIKRQLQPVYALCKEKRRELAELHADELKALDAARERKVKAARQTSGLYWGNYNAIIASYNTARKNFRGDLRHQYPDGTGRITVQFITPLRWKDLFGENGQIQMTPVDQEKAWDKEGLKRRRKRYQWTTARVRIRTNPATKEPMWLELPVCLDRAVPETATIQMASVVMKNVGGDGHLGRVEYSLNLVLRFPEVKKVDRGMPAAVVDFCSVLQEDRSLHVATVTTLTTDGKPAWEERLVVPVTTTSQIEKVDDLKSILGKYQAAAQDGILQLRKAGAGTGADLPDWFLAATEFTHAWRMEKRYLQLLKTWEKSRFPGDGKAFDLLGTFAERYGHLYPWQFNLRQQIYLRRREQYRIFASELVKKFDRVVLNQIPGGEETAATSAVGRMAKKSKLDANIRRIRAMAARGELRQIIRNTA